MLVIVFRGGNTVQLHITGLFQTADYQKWNMDTKRTCWATVKASSVDIPLLAILLSTIEQKQ